MLHQKLKFMFDDKLVIVCGEEDLLVSELSSFKYVEIEAGIAEIPLHCLEFQDVSSATCNHDQSFTTILSSVISVGETLEKGMLFGWGKVVNVTEKHDKFGIGYHPSKCKANLRKQKKFNPVRFNSACFQSDHTVAVVGEASCIKK